MYIHVRMSKHAGSHHNTNNKISPCFSRVPYTGHTEGLRVAWPPTTTPPARAERLRYFERLLNTHCLFELSFANKHALHDDPSKWFLWRGGRSWEEGGGRVRIFVTIPPRQYFFLHKSRVGWKQKKTSAPADWTSVAPHAKHHGVYPVANQLSEIRRDQAVAGAGLTC